MKNIFSFVALCFVVFLTHGQISENMSNTGMQIYTKSNTPDEFTGTPYAEDDFIYGTIYDENKNNSQSAFLRYNAVEDVIEIRLQKNDKSSVLPKYTHIFYKIGDYTYFIDNLNTDKGTIEAYFARYYNSDNVKFVARPVPKITPAQAAKTGYGKSKPANLNVEKEYYLSTDGNYYQEVRLKEKDFAKIFKSDRMEKYLDDHKIKSEQDVVEMLKFYEQNS